MEATYCIGSDVDVCRMFDQYLYKRSENLDLSLSVAHGLHNTGYNMSDQTFHTPSFGDEDFDIPPINPQQHSNSMGYHQPPMSMSSMSDTTDMSDPHSGYQQPLFLSPAHEHSMGLSVSASYSSGLHQHQGAAPHYSMPGGGGTHLLQHGGFMGPPYARSPHRSSPPVSGHPPHDNTTTSDDSDDSAPHPAMLTGMKRPSPEPADNIIAKIQKKPKAQKKKKKRDPNEPQKPVSAYALFFRDTQAAIKGQNPNASFGEVSKIVASMWDALDADHKNVYKKKTEAAKKDYLKALAAYRASLVSKGAGDSESMYGAYGGYGGGYSSYSPPTGLPSPPMSVPSQHQQHISKKPLMMADTRPQQQAMLGGHMGHQQHNMQQQSNANYMQQQGATGGSRDGNGQSVSPPPNPLPAGPSYPSLTANICIRQGCVNPAVSNPEWEDEYCSNECVVSHCKDVFNSWVASNKPATLSNSSAN